MNMSILLTALIAIESGGDPYAVGDNGQAVGVLQIHPGVIKDLNEWTDLPNYCLRDRLDQCMSRRMATEYLVHYLTTLRRWRGEAPSYEAAARIWNGGYAGYKRGKTATDNYWQKVRAELVRLGVAESEL